MTTETAIALRLVRAALAAGYSISVRDGYEGDGEIVLARSTDEAAVMGALQSSDGDMLYLRHAERPQRLVGWVTLIWGNDEDVISDYSDNEATAALVNSVDPADAIKAEG